MNTSIYSDGRNAGGQRQSFYTLHGRDSRLEFFGYSAGLLVLMLLVGWVANSGSNPGILYLLTASAWVMYLASLWRRAHDIGWSGWWALLGFIPLIGLFQMVVFWCTPGDPSNNKYGPSPLRKAPPT